MLYLITGSPGSGKTLSAMAFIAQVKKETPERLIYEANINGFNVPGVIHLDNDQVSRWFEVCEKNSIIFVDEAQKFWRAQRAGDVPQAIIEMETHRHDGIDIVMMTQHPTLLHSNLRKLINEHVHLIAYTKKSALRWQWRECHDDVQDTSLRASGEFKEWVYPAELFDQYQSATQHTKRAKRPLKQILARVGLGFAALVLVGVFLTVGVMIHNYRKTKTQAQASAIQSSPDADLAKGFQASSTKHYASTKDYIAAQIPRVASQPWSAPLYDGAAVTRHPRIFCMSMEPPGKCRCITEQGTRYLVNDTMCRDIAKNGGPYDPYLPVDHEPSRDDRARSESSDRELRAAASTIPAASALPQVVQTSSGSGGISQAYVPPSYQVPMPSTAGYVGGK